MIAVLLPPPLGCPSRLPALADRLDAHGVSAVRPRIEGDELPPHAARYVARASLEISRLAAPGTPVALVAEGDAGPLVGAVGAAQRAAHRPVLGYVLVDALLPRPGVSTRAEIAASQGAEGAQAFPAEPGEPPGYRTEHLPAVADWPDAPCGYLLTDPARAHLAHLARMRGWPVRRTRPEEASEALAGLLRELRGRG